MSEGKALSIAAKIKEAGGHAIIYGLGSVAQSAVSLILLPILTGSLTKDDFGAYSLISLGSTVASAVFYLGMTSALPRSYFDYASDEDRRAVFTTAFVMLLAGAILQSVLGQVYARDIARFLVGDEKFALPTARAMLGGALTFVTQYFFAYLRLLRKSIASVLFSLFSLAGSIGLTLIFLNRTPGDISAPFEAIAYGQLAVALVFAFIYGRTAFCLKIQMGEIGKLVHFGVASIFASFGHMLLEWTDRILIGRFMTLADVGVYSAAFRVGMLVNVLLILPFSQIWSPMMIEYRDRSNIKDLFKYVFSLFMVIGGVVVIASALFAQELLPILIRSGVDAVTTTVFIVVTAGVLVFGATNFVVAGLFYERKVFQLSYIYYGAAFVKAAINFLLIPLFGLVGAALSALFAYFMVPLGIYQLAKRYFSFDIEWRRLAIFCGVACPSLLYGLFGAAVYSVNFFGRAAWFLLTLALIYRLCLSYAERARLKAFVSNAGRS